MTPTAPAADPSAPTCCPTSEASPCVACSSPTAVSTRRTEVARLHAKGLSVPAISRALGRRRHTVHADLRALGLTPHRPPPRGHKRPKNNSPERQAAVAVGVMSQRLDDSFGLILADVLEELTAVFPGLGSDELGSLARSLTIRLVQRATATWFPHEYADRDPAEHLAARRDVLLRRAEMEERAGRRAESEHWRAVAAGIDVGTGGLIPATGILQRVSPDGFASLVARLRGGPADE